MNIVTPSSQFEASAQSTSKTSPPEQSEAARFRHEDKMEAEEKEAKATQERLRGNQSKVQTESLGLSESCLEFAVKAVQGLAMHPVAQQGLRPLAPVLGGVSFLYKGLKKAFEIAAYEKEIWEHLNTSDSGKPSIHPDAPEQPKKKRTLSGPGITGGVA